MNDLEKEDGVMGKSEIRQKNCDDDGHIWGPEKKCIFCKTDKPPAQPPRGALENPRSLPNHIVSALVSVDRCPNCLGYLDTGWECNWCGYDAKPWIDASTEAHNRAHDNREG